MKWGWGRLGTRKGDFRSQTEKGLRSEEEGIEAGGRREQEMGHRRQSEDWRETCDRLEYDGGEGQ